VCDEGLQGQAKLVGLRLILRVEHRDERAADEWQRGVERLRLGARAVLGGEYDLEGRSELQLCDRLARNVVVGFEDQFDIQLFERVIRYYGANATSPPAGGRSRD
jgi:hypothetical protein